MCFTTLMSNLGMRIFNYTSDFTWSDVLNGLVTSPYYRDLIKEYAAKVQDADYEDDTSLPMTQSVYMYVGLEERSARLPIGNVLEPFVLLCAPLDIGDALSLRSYKVVMGGWGNVFVMWSA